MSLHMLLFFPALLSLLGSSVDASSFEPPAAASHHLVWGDITLEVSNNKPSTLPRRRTVILENVSGQALPGRLLAIMGPSGSGKSSLLNVLAGRVPAAKQNRLEGVVVVGDTDLSDFDTQRYVAYVRQEQSFYPFLTVRETLLIKAGLRLDRSVPIAQKEHIVSEIMEKLGLSASADTLVGDLKNPGISGGEKRRLAIGLQMIGLESPSIVLIDEPSSGLDSHQALQMMATIRDLCSEGHTVVVAIHQPRSSIYAMFDDVLLLSDGRVMYHGATDEALPRLASLGHRCPKNFNPADFMVDLISPDDVGRHGENNKQNAVLISLAEAARRDWEKKSPLLSGDWTRHQDRHRWWEAGSGYESGEEQDEEGQETGQELGDGLLSHGGDGVLLRAVSPASPSFAMTVSNPIGAPARRKKKRAGSSWVTQFGLLLRRSWRQATRDKFAAVARVALGFGLGGVFGSIFWKLSLDEGCIANRVSLFVNVAMNVAMFGCVRALQTLAVETGVVNQERMEEGYSASAYLSSKILAELPTDGVFPLIFGSTVYFMAGLNTPVGGGRKLARFLGTLLVQGHASSALGLMVGCVSPSMEAANLTGPALMIVSLMLSGVHDNIPPFLARLKVLSTVNWGVQGIVTNEMRGVKFVPDGKALVNGWKLGTNKQVIPGEDVMARMGFEGQGLRKPTTRLLQLSFGCHFITLLNLMAGAPKFQRLEAPPAASGPVSSLPSSPPSGNREESAESS
eukprot:g5117.t1